MIKIYSTSEKMQKKGVDLFRSYLPGGLNFSISGSNASLQTYQNTGDITSNGLIWKGVSSAGGFLGSYGYLLSLTMNPVTLPFSFACDYSLSGNYNNAFSPQSGSMPFLRVTASGVNTGYADISGPPNLQSGMIKVIGDGNTNRVAVYLNNISMIVLDLQNALSFEIGILGLNGEFEDHPTYDMTAYLKNVKYVSGVRHHLSDDWFQPHTADDMIRGPKFFTMENRKVYVGGQFHTIKATDRIFKDGKWRFINHVHTWNAETGTCPVCGDACAHNWKNTNGICSICGKTHSHVWDSATGTCTVCGWIHTPHDWSASTGICSICGKVCTHEFVNGICSICGKVCTHEFVNGICSICGWIATGTLNVIYSKISGDSYAYLMNILEYRLDEETAWRYGSFTEAAVFSLPVGAHKIIFHTSQGFGGYMGQFRIEFSMPITSEFKDSADKELTFDVIYNATVNIYAVITRI